MPQVAELARALVDSLLVYKHLLRATVQDALQSHWIVGELEELDNLYKRRIISALERA